MVTRRWYLVLVVVGLFVFPSASRTFDAPANSWERTELPTENIEFSPLEVGIDVRDGFKAVAIRTLDRSDSRFRGRKLYVTTSRGDDDAWSEPVEIAGSDHDIQASPLIRIDSRNHLHVIWQEEERSEGDLADATYRIRYATYDGQAWTEPITLFERSTPFEFPRALVLCDDDRLHFPVSAYTEQGQASRNYYVAGRGDEWTVAEVEDGTPVPGPPDVALESSLAMSASGVLHLVFVAGSGDSDNDLYHTYSLDEGATWASAQRIYTSGARFALNPALRAGPGDALHLAWREAPTRGTLPDEAYHAYLSEDRLLSETAREAGSESGMRCQTSHLTADLTSQFASAPSLSVTSSGQALVVVMTLRDLRAGEGSIYDAYWNGQWQDFAVLESSPGGNPTATVYHDGTVYAVYSRAESSGSEEERTIEVAHQPVPFDGSAEVPACPDVPTDPEEGEGSVTPYPNPTSGSLSIDVCPPEEVEFVELRLYNALGQRVRALPRQLVDDALRCTTIQDLSVKDLASGVYFVQAVAEGEVFDTSPVVLAK